MKVFGYHNSNNGVSLYRVWQPLKYLDRLGFETRRLPDRLDSVQMPMDGDGGNIPDAPSHMAVTQWSDVLFSNFRRTLEDTLRLKAQATLAPLVLDIDDDIEGMDPNNPAWKDWQGLGHDSIVEVPLGATDEELELRKKEGWALVRHSDGKRYLTMPSGLTGWDNVRTQLESAHVVTVSTDYLADAYRKHSKNVVVVPNAVDFEVWKRVESEQDGLIRIGLFGSNSHYRDWREVVDAVKRILSENENVRFLFNGWLVLTEAAGPGELLYQKERHFRLPDYFVEAGLHEHPQVEIHESVEIRDYAEWLMSKKLDIGLAPLADTRFNRCKSNLKYLEFGAMGVPAVYADAEAYKDVQHGVTGLKAGKASEYYTQLKKLVNDADLRKRLGDASHEDVRARYDAAKVAETLAGAVRLAKETFDHEKAATH